MNKLLNYVKNASQEDLEQLKVIIGLLASELERWTYTEELEEIEEIILEEIDYKKVLYELLVSYNNGKDFELIAEYETIEQATEKQTIEANYWLSNQSFKKNEKIIYEINKIEYDANDEQIDNIDFISELEIFGNY